MSEEHYVLNSSAILCTLFHEPGGKEASRYLEGALINAVNLTEVVTKLQDKGVGDSVIDDIILDLKLKTVFHSQSLAINAGKLRNLTRTKGLSLGDRACLALAIERGAIAVTTDRAWQDVNCGARVLLVR